MEYIKIDNYLTESFLEENFLENYNPIMTEFVSKKGNVIISFYGSEPVDIEINNIPVEQEEVPFSIFVGGYNADLLHNGDYIEYISKDLINKINSIIL